MSMMWVRGNPGVGGCGGGDMNGRKILGCWRTEGYYVLYLEVGIRRRGKLVLKSQTQEVGKLERCKRAPK